MWRQLDAMLGGIEGWAGWSSRLWGKNIYLQWSFCFAINSLSTTDSDQLLHRWMTPESSPRP